MFYSLLLRNNPRGTQVVEKNPRTPCGSNIQHRVVAAPTWTGIQVPCKERDQGAPSDKLCLTQLLLLALLRGSSVNSSQKSLLQLFSHGFKGFFIAKCCPILLLVAGSDQDTVRFSVCASVWIFHAGRGRGRERGRNRNEKYMLQES